MESCQQIIYIRQQMTERMKTIHQRFPNIHSVLINVYYKDLVSASWPLIWYFLQLLLDHLPHGLDVDLHEGEHHGEQHPGVEHLYLGRCRQGL
jgi:hypothetical protein